MPQLQFEIYSPPYTNITLDIVHYAMYNLYTLLFGSQVNSCLEVFYRHTTTTRGTVSVVVQHSNILHPIPTIANIKPKRNNKSVSRPVTTAYHLKK